MILRSVAIAIAALSCTAHGSVLVLEGFETNAGDWQPAYLIAQVASGGGALHLPSASGSYYGEVTNLDDGYGYPGLGDGGYSRFGFASPTSYPGDFFQSIDVYIDPTWAPAAAGYSAGFWIDMSPGHPAGNWGAEHNFRVWARGTSVVVTVDGDSAEMATILGAGWYSFEMTYHKGASPADLVSTDMTIYDASHNLLGSQGVVSNSVTGPLLSSQLGGPGYVWLTVWQNGFAGDTLAIDDVKTETFGEEIPEPTTAGIAAWGLLLLGWRAARRR